MRASLLHLTCAAALLMPLQASAQLTEGFDNVNTLPGWVLKNNSQPVGLFGWSQGVGDPTVFFPSFSGAPDSYIASAFDAVGFPEDFDPNFSGTLSNWLLTPELSLFNGATFSFYTRASDIDQFQFPDRLELRLSTSGASTDVGSDALSVGDFTTLLLSVNPLLGVEYPTVWTQYSTTLTGLTEPVSGRFAFRHFVTNVSESSNAYYIGVDEVSYAALPMIVPEPGSLLLFSAGMLGFAARKRRA